ncbi:hypothetical protein GW626_06635 [Peribacillus muralis]|uniref:hypothetical protein n=1 Tax=Peribacillus muralis TaxID=264697 RepID=UPI001F4DB9DE|nr:hypothetical protein [Peribacillus muralis]MCK1992689.1 hypothetical protein [Peribacillus muralis]MCK2013244.1 hypothetical protein [Peribacillus muralis]
MSRTLSHYDIRGIMAELRPITESEARHFNMELSWKVRKEPIRVHCTKDQLKQVILNISKNGFEAMKAGEKLSRRIYHEK